MGALERLITMMMDVTYKLYITLEDSSLKKKIGEYTSLSELRKTIKQMTETNKAELSELSVIRHRYITDENTAEWYLTFSNRMGNGHHNV